MFSSKQINVVRLAGLISAIGAAIVTYMTSGDFVTASGLVGAAVATFGGKQP